MRPPWAHVLILSGVTALVVGPVSASAAPTQADVAISLRNAVVAADGPTKNLRVRVDSRGRFVPLADGTVTYEYRGPAGVRLVAPTRGWESCGGRADRLVCALPSYWDLYGENDVLPAVGLRAAAVRPGVAGTLRVTFADPHVGSVTTTARVRVTEGAALVVGADREVAVRPAQRFVRDLVVRNDGDRPVSGVVATFDGTHNLAAAGTDFRNCRYAPDGYLLSCEFRTVLAPRRTYRAAMPMRVDARAHAPGAQSSWVKWAPIAHAPEELVPAAGARYGGGPDLTLAAVPRSAREAPVRAADGPRPPHVSVTTVKVAGRNPADVGLVGTVVRSARGRTVALTATVVNHGPADLEARYDDSAVVGVDITLPVGVTVVEEPEAYCESPRAGTYRCYTSDAVLRAGGAEEIVFRVRVDALVPGGSGAAVLVTDDADLAHHRGDPQPANDAAALTVAG